MIIDIYYIFYIRDIFDLMTDKTKRALDQTNLKTLVISGGVSANKLLRETAKTTFSKNNISVYYPRLEFCTDNGAMIEITGSLHGLNKSAIPPQPILARARWPLSISL